MNTRLNQIVWGVVLATAISAHAESPHIGYAYPAGGRQGSSFRVMVGGQYLEGATNVFVTGEGVSVDIVRFSRKYSPREYRRLQRGKKNAESMLEEKTGTERERLLRRIKLAEKKLAIAEIPPGMGKKKKRSRYKPDSKEQFNPQIADRLRVDVIIDKDASPCGRELRVETVAGLSNPIYFEVGTLKEYSELEPNDDHMDPALQTVSQPCIINGQIRPGDIDHFRFEAEKNQSIVVDVGARKIIPYLADAVPGWFQAVVTLYDDEGDEVAYQDDYKFNPDPVLFFDVPETGTYTLSIKDSIYRGREDFVYRIAIGELPFITSLFPLGAQAGTEVEIQLFGKNLPWDRLTGVLPEDNVELHNVSVEKDGYRSNQLPFAIGELPEILEVEPNDAESEAQPIREPVIVNGTIQQSGDYDTFSFQGKKGDAVSIEVVARRLLSPLDSVVMLTGPGIERPLRNDDNVDKGENHLFLGAGLITHYADSYLHHVLPATGTYFVRIGDTQSKGGIDYGYRLRVGPTTPDFQLRMEPSGLKIAPGGTAAFTVRALRKDGFQGRIVLEIDDLPQGFKMSKSEIPAGSDSIRLTITAPKTIDEKVLSPKVTGRGIIEGRSVVRTAVPVDDQMQAFLYRHLVPAQELMLAPADTPIPLVFKARLPASGIIELPLGEEVQIHFRGTTRKGGRRASLKVDNPPAGLDFEKGSISQEKADGRRARGRKAISGQITLKAGDPLKPGDQFNIVVVASVKQRKEEMLFPAPAIPVKVVQSRGN